MVNETAGQSEYEFDWQNPNYVKPQYQLGRVISRTYKGVIRQWKPIGLAIFCYVALNIFLSLISYGITGQTGFEPEAAEAALEPLALTISIISGLLGWFGIVFVMIVTDAALFSEYTKQPTTFKILARKGLRKMVPITFGLILYLIAYYIGFIFFIIPGLLVYLGWSIFGPVYVNEDQGLFASFGRSWNLMRGYKRWFFLASLIIGLINGIFMLVTFTIMFLPIMPSLDNPSATPDWGIGFLIVMGVAYTIVFLLYAVLTASMTTANYLEVKQLKEGADHADIGDVFA